MTKAEKVIQSAKEALGSPYVFGAWGDLCTPTLRKKYAGYNPSHAEAIKRNCPVLSNKAEDCEGCKYEGKLAYDCRGFTHWCFKQVGIEIAGAGATTQYNTGSNWTVRGVLDDMPDAVCCVFKQDGKTMQHTGVHIGGGVVIHCSVGVQYGKITDRGWSHFAIPTGLYDEEVHAKVVMRQGSRGDNVKQLQEYLNKLGYDCGTADGVYGAKTTAAVKTFQSAHKLTADGIAGDRTQAAIALEIAKLNGEQSGPGQTEPGGSVSPETIASLKLALTDIKTQAEQTADKATQALRLLEEGGAK